MPIYEYKCSACNAIFEKIQKSTEAKSAKCPTCGKTAQRLISKTSFSLKGSGWYKDGYSSPKTKSDACKSCPAECPAKKADLNKGEKT